MTLLYSTVEGTAAGVFTTNRLAAAPVELDRQHLHHGRGQAVIVNSGNANACTGRQGMKDAKDMAAVAAKELGIRPVTVYVGSTGVIGNPLPMQSIRQAIPSLVARLRRTGGHEAAQAILTTDTRAKEVAARTTVGGRRVTIGGMAKGAGMVHPNMATLLAYLTTDAAIPSHLLQRALTAAVEESFNRVSIDGDTSTNDTVLCLANGMSENASLQLRSRDFARFSGVLMDTCRELALQICQDGEGVSKIVQLVIQSARTTADAGKAARTIATSLLVKTAWFGEDANWGRIMAALGRSGIPLKPDRIGVTVDDIPLVRHGVGLGMQAERQMSRVLRRRTFTVTVDLGLGSASYRLWMTDLSYDYVKINASYRS